MSRPSRSNTEHNIFFAFHHLLYPTKHPILVSVPDEEFQNMFIGDDESIFLQTAASRIFDATGFKINSIHGLSFAVVNRPLREFRGPNWTEKFDLSLLEWGETYETLKYYFPNGLDSDVVHLLIAGNRGTYELTDNKYFHETLEASKILSPSTASSSNQYTKLQANPFTAINDGLVSDKSGALSTNAPPITIYCPVFEDFVRRVHSSQHDPLPLDFIQQVLEFSATASKIKAQKETIRQQLSKLLGIQVHLDGNADSMAANGVEVHRVGSDQYFLAIIEFKRNFGEGGCDATIQNGNYIRATLVDDSRKDLVYTSCCPMFLITLAGPWLNIAGGLLSTHFIVQRLTDTLWVPLSSTHSNDRLLHLSKVLFALKHSLENLKQWYFKVHEHKIPYSPSSPHPRLFPYPNFFVRDSITVSFKYRRSLEKVTQCVSFLAELCNEKKSVVVKFVDRYGDDVHTFLASLGHAPELVYYGNLPSDVFYQGKPAPPILPDWTLMHSSSPITANMKMVVMEYVEPSPSRTLPQHVFPQLLKILRDLHEAGMVFGDFRLQNMIWTRGGKVKLIDFDWSGRYDADIDDTQEYLSCLHTLHQKLHPGSDTPPPPPRVQSTKPAATYPLTAITCHPKARGGGGQYAPRMICSCLLSLSPRRPLECTFHNCQFFYMYSV